MTIVERSEAHTARDVAVTVVGRSASSQEPDAQGLTDEDTVDLWREIPHPGHAPVASS